MNSLFSPEQDGLNDASEISSADRLLESGFFCIQQGRYVEGLAFFALAREKLSSDQVQLAAALDALAQSHVSYLQTREELLQASRHFVQADAEQYNQIATLRNLLTPAPGAIKGVSLHADKQQEQVKGQPMLRILRPASGGLPTDQATGQLPVERVGNEGKRSLSPADVDPPLFPGLYITCFGHFEVKRLDKPVLLCSNRHAQTILRYLVAQPERCATSDMLMTLLWPEEELEVAQPRLHTSICALRRSLNAGYTNEPGGGYIVCKNRTYCLNAAIPIQTDVDQFLHYYQLGRQSGEERNLLYEKACRLYSGPFLIEDTYAGWSSRQREYLYRLYIDMCRILSEHYLEIKRYEEAEERANTILKGNQCDEMAYQQLMRIYAAQGRRSEVFQQYQHCERVLRDELAVSPMPETLHLMQMLLESASSSTSSAKI